ncbi:MAG: hypothetical protein M5U25_13115 [Planctomycetota bacterium]|nr:hypothetical protein [Planctomycetota bacterium]
MPLRQPAKFETAPYYELIERYGMQPRYHLLRIDDQTWALTSPDAGLVRLQYETALEIMAVDALLWLRRDLGYQVADEDIEAQPPAKILRMVRDTVSEVAIR